MKVDKYQSKFMIFFGKIIFFPTSSFSLRLKVDTMEENMADVAEKVTSVLTKLDRYAL